MGRRKEEIPKTITIDNPRSPISEAFRTLRTNISFAGVDKPVKKILITGANPSCGKTTIVANLGVTLAQTGSSVLLVDADLRKPTLNRFFNLSNGMGLTSLIIKRSEGEQKAIQQTKIENLFVLPSGPVPPYPAELLSSQKMKNLINKFSEHFEYLVIDSPPVIAVTDAAILSRMVDGTLLVLDHGRVTRDEATMAVEQLKKVNARVIGTVFNKVPFKQGYYDYYRLYYRTDPEDRKKGKRNR